MNIKSLCLLPCLSLLSFCSKDPIYYEVGDTYIAEYSWVYDSFGYEIVFEQKNENTASLRILKSTSNEHNFVIRDNSKITNIYVNGEKVESIYLNYLLNTLLVYPIDFISYEDEEISLALVDITFSSADFDYLSFGDLSEYNGYFWLGVEPVTQE